MSTLALVKLDTESSIIEAAAKRVHLAIARSSLIWVSGTLCFYLHRVQSTSDEIRSKLSDVDVSVAESRAFLRDVAINLGQAATAIGGAYDLSEQQGLNRIPIFGPRLMRQLETLSCSLEDMAETAALGAHEAFSTAVVKELRENLDTHRTERRTATA